MALHEGDDTDTEVVVSTRCTEEAGKLVDTQFIQQQNSKNVTAYGADTSPTDQAKKVWV